MPDPKSIDRSPQTPAPPQFPCPTNQPLSARLPYRARLDPELLNVAVRRVTRRSPVPAMDLTTAAGAQLHGLPRHVRCLQLLNPVRPQQIHLKFAAAPPHRPCAVSRTNRSPAVFDPRPPASLMRVASSPSAPRPPWAPCSQAAVAAVFPCLASDPTWDAV
ncbi:DBF4-type zinc finger-containing protein 2 homolog isoform X2 [Triticum urartu]|uniref:DBF4-type zinc finger-containing protein 2 homolog isoform X2 n=1 Tax=Triticum urartu TaxID=4572 RepID=UPI002044B0A8|nr:DBF4-type zinc finger-containing protein 2 homolog isoform X2 [Triticum urartu]